MAKHIEESVQRTLPSDIHGLVYIPFQKRVSEVKQRLADELQEAGFHIRIKDLRAN